MEDTLIIFETAKLAKEKGFNILQHSYYFEDGEFKENSLKGTNGYYGEEYEFNLSEFNENWNDKWLTKKTGDRCFGCSKQKGYLETFSAPTQSLLQKWLREVHGLVVASNISKTSFWYNWTITYKIKNINRIISVGDPYQKSYEIYEQALEIGLLEALKLITLK